MRKSKKWKGYIHGKGSSCIEVCVVKKPVTNSYGWDDPTSKIILFELFAENELEYPYNLPEDWEEYWCEEDIEQAKKIIKIQPQLQQLVDEIAETMNKSSVNLEDLLKGIN